MVSSIVHKKQPLKPILIRFIPDNFLETLPLSYVLISSSNLRLGLPCCLGPHVFQLRYFYAYIANLSHPCYITSPFYPSWFDHPYRHNILWRTQLRNSSLWNVSRLQLLLLGGANICLNTKISETLNLRYFLIFRDDLSYPCETTRIITVIYIF
jgi:hypothetical protein